jgi:polysaccharide biosynthesis protein PslH
MVNSAHADLKSVGSTVSVGAGLGLSSGQSANGVASSKPKGIVVLGPAWVACGSYEVFRRQMECCRHLGFKTYFLAIGPTLTITNRSTYWGYYYQHTTNLGADERGHTGRSTNVFKFPALITDFVPGIFRSAAFWKSAHTRLMVIPDTLKAFIAAHDIDTIICHHFFDMPMAKKIRRLVPRAQLILETQDVQTNHYVAGKAINPVTRKVSSEAAMLKDEMAMSGEADVLIHYNDHEADVFKSHLPSKRHVTVYPAFARNYRKTSDNNLDEPFDFLIVASGNDPNYRSVRDFLSQVWAPSLAGKRTLRIVGNIDGLFNLYKDPLIEQFRESFIGIVPELTPWYHRARYVLMPVVEGQGIAIKTVEALSYGKRFVAMPLAYRGFSERVPKSLASEIVPDFKSFTDRMLSLDVSGQPEQDKRAIALYEELFTTERQTEVYRELLVDGRAPRP